MWIREETRPEKSNAMHLFAVAAWLASGAWFGPRILATYPFPELVGLRVVYVFMGVALAIFWYYAFYHYALILLTHVERRRRRRRRPGAGRPQERSLLEAPLVALLYTTADDFVEEAALSCVNQDYPRLQVFLLDDSRTEEGRLQVERFHHRHFYRTSLVRREERVGFKAGNLNHFLSTRGQMFPFFAIADADESLPPDFLSSSLRYFVGRPWLGFVQASHTNASPTLSAFSRDFQDETRIRWEYNNTPRNRYGFPLFLGHGVVARVDAWAAAGGFPEVVAEDVAFTIAMRMRGYYGLFAPEIVCGEGFPEGLNQFARRHFRMVMGDTEALMRFGLPLLRRGDVSLAEKLDLLTHAFRRTASGLVLPFILGTVLLQFAGAQEGALLTDGTLPRAQGGPVAWDLALLGLVGLMAPLARVLLEKWRQPVGALTHAGRALYLYMTLALESTLAVVTFLLAGRAHFAVTGARVREGQPPPRVGIRDRIARLNVNHPLEVAASLVLALLLSAFGVLTLNLALAGVGVATLSLHLMSRLGWESRLAQGLALSSGLLMVSGVFLGPLHVAGPEWQYVVVMGASVLVRT